MQTELHDEQGVAVRTSVGREIARIYDERVQPREEKEKRGKLNEEERNELHRLLEAQGRLYTVVSKSLDIQTTSFLIMLFRLSSRTESAQSYNFVYLAVSFVCA